MPKRNRFKDFLWRHSAGLAFLVMVVFVAFIGFVGWAYVVVTKKFDSSRRWDLPSRVYSDATPIIPGMALPRTLLEPKLNHVGYHEVKTRISTPSEYRYVDGNLELYLQNFDYPDMEFRALPVLVEFVGGESAPCKRLDDNVPLRGVRIEPELITSIYNDEMEDRQPVSLSAVPKVVSNAHHLDGRQELLPPRRDLHPRHVRRVHHRRQKQEHDARRLHAHAAIGE